MNADHLPTDPMTSVWLAEAFVVNPRRVLQADMREDDQGGTSSTSNPDTSDAGWVTVKGSVPVEMLRPSWFIPQQGMNYDKIFSSRADYVMEVNQEGVVRDFRFDEDVSSDAWEFPVWSVDPEPITKPADLD